MYKFSHTPALPLTFNDDEPRTNEKESKGNEKTKL